ncbi:MAG: indole-3-glycerol-phosphate synthase TrpC, partial [Candidatus Eisenbacteria bacterium]
MTARKGIDFLADITRDRRRRIEAMKLDRPQGWLRAQLAPGRTAGRLEQALRRATGDAPLNLLCEVKRASPSKGVLSEQVDPVGMAQLYQQGGAAAVSLVTEPDHFLGDPSWMDRVRPAVELPL